MNHVDTVLNPGNINDLISKLREGSPITLVCQRFLAGFTPAGMYPVHSISMGTALCIKNDYGDEILLDKAFPALDFFHAVSDMQQAFELSESLQNEAMLRLAMAAKRYLQPKVFSEGDTVSWIAGMQICSMPELYQPAVVLEVLETPIQDADAHLFDPVRTIKADMVIGFMEPGGNMVTTFADSRRFEMHSYQISRMQ